MYYKGEVVTSKWENRDRKLTRKRSLKEMNVAHKHVDSEAEAKKEREKKIAKANKLKSEIEELFEQST
tara:strand:- start:2085 stop:2288 length:204 start_codon:yes stop_codon:yes gene_type:complete